MHHAVALYSTTLMVFLIKQIVNHVFQVPAKPVQTVVLVILASVIKIRAIHAFCRTALALWGTIQIQLYKLIAFVSYSNFIKINH
jgi:hypothetical protein